MNAFRMISTPHRDWRRPFHRGLYENYDNPITREHIEACLVDDPVTFEWSTDGSGWAKIPRSVGKTVKVEDNPSLAAFLARNEHRGPAETLKAGLDRYSHLSIEDLFRT